MPQKKNNIILCISMLFTAVIIILAIQFSSVKIRDKLNLELQNTLKLAAEQNTLFCEKELSTEQNFLHGIARALPVNSFSQKNALIDILRPYTELYNVKRLGFIYPDGTAYTTDGYCIDLSLEDSFKYGMEGRAYVSDVIVDKIGLSEKINIFSIPVYYQNGNTVAGVLFAAYRTEMFLDLLNLECFEGNGYSCIVKPDGSIIAASEASPFFDKKNLFSVLQELGINFIPDTKTTASKQGTKSGLAICHMPEEHYFYYMPLDASITYAQWYIITIVPTDILNKRVVQVLHYVNLLLFIVIITLVTVFCYYLYSYWHQKKLLSTLAYMDPLTGGDNYACFKNKMQQEKGISGFIISTDIYEFRIINNTCGTQKGNQVLKGVWHILSSQLREGELAAHIHADRFILFLKEQPDISLPGRISKINASVAQLTIDLNTPRIMLYLGIYPTNNPEDTEKGYGCANQAKHAIKNCLNQNYSYYEDIHFQQHLEDLNLIDSFEEAIQNHRFEVWYQPKYSTRDQSIVSAEALVRWRDKDGSMIPPHKFIPLLEKKGMISILDEYIFEAVCRQQKQWEKEGRQLFPVSVNISRSSLYYSNIVEKYSAILKMYSLSPNHIELEITESAAINNTEIQTLIDKFHETGFRILLDDFGNGYSSLSTLNQMHFDTLKLDKSLIDYIGEEKGEKLLYHVIKLAQSLGLKITAEGVEYESQFEFLRDLRCDDIQGYYFSKPLPLNDYQSLLYHGA